MIQLKYQAFSNLAYLMFGLLTACLYIIYDTQMIIERAERGDKDVITHAMTLFIDLFELFIRILQILLELQKSQEEENERKKRRN
jgi:Bax inhibitor 1